MAEQKADGFLKILYIDSWKPKACEVISSIQEGSFGPLLPALKTPPSILNHWGTHGRSPRPDWAMPNDLQSIPGAKGAQGDFQQA